jgi:hypothetical protein
LDMMQRNAMKKMKNVGCKNATDKERVRDVLGYA